MKKTQNNTNPKNKDVKQVLKKRAEDSAGTFTIAELNLEG